MATYSVKEFAELTGVAPKNIHTYIGRGKLNKNKNGLIDTKNVLNEIFFSKKTGSKPINNSEIEVRQTKTQEPEKQEKKTDSASAIIQLEYATKKLQAQKIQKDIALKDIEIKKKNNELVELDKFVLIAKSFSDGLKRELHESMKILIQDICARHDIEIGKAGEYKLKIANLINDSSDKATQELLKQFK